MLGKLLVPGGPTCTYMDNRRATDYCACSRCGGGCLYIFSLVFFLSRSLGDGSRLKNCIKGSLNLKNQPTNKPPKIQQK